MKVLVLLGVIFLSGCGSFQSLDQLEDQAFLTGDWSAVESRERLIAKRKARSGLQCPAGQVGFCEKRTGRSRCGCVDRGELIKMWLNQ